MGTRTSPPSVDRALQADRDAFMSDHDLSTEALCARLYERHREHIDVKKPKTAIANLEKITRATLVLAERGSFHEMSMRDLARQSGLSTGVLYTHIRDKDGLLHMMLDVVTDTVDRVLAEVPPEVRADPRARLRWTVDTHVRLTEAMPQWFAFAYMEAKSFGPAARKRAMEAEMSTETLIREALKAGVAEGVFRPTDPEFTAALVKPLLQEWYLKRWKYRRRGITPDAYVDAVINLIENGVLR